jgi:hypothetical protein
VTSIDGTAATLVLAATLFAIAPPAAAVPVGTGTLLVECGSVCCPELTFDSITFDVFGTPIDLGTGVGSVRSTNVAITIQDPVTGLFAGTAQSIIPGLLEFGMSGSFICGIAGCEPGAVNTFVGDIANLGGSFTLPAGLSYTLDGSNERIDIIGSPTIPGCPPGGPIRVYTGVFGINAFQDAATPTGSDVQVATSTTFFNPVTGTEVTIAIDASFAEVAGAGETIVRAYSNTSGAVPGNFAAQVTGSCAVDGSIDCCADADCPSGACNGCYRPAYIDVTTTATVSGPIEICTVYPDADDDGFVDGTAIPEGRLRFLHEEAEVFVDRTSSFDPVANRICAEVSHLSFFVVALDLVSGCALSPVPGCRAADKSLLLLKNNVTDDAGDKLTWKWLKGAETELNEFGQPADTTDYTLCIYSGGEVAEAAIPAGANWQPSGASGLKYQSGGVPAGIQKAKLKAGDQAKSKVLVKGKGAALPDELAPTLALPVTVQLVNDTNGVCFEAAYGMGDIIKNDPGFFKAKAD